MCALFCQNSLAKVKSQFLIYTHFFSCLCKLLNVPVSKRIANKITVLTGFDLKTVMLVNEVQKVEQRG